jgi:hypothetical protein
MAGRAFRSERLARKRHGNEDGAAAKPDLAHQRCVGDADHHAGRHDLGLLCVRDLRAGGYEEQILYWSNFLQLVFLPIITVGTTILSRDSEARAIEDHKKISKEFDMLRDHDKRVAQLLQEMSAGISQLHLLVAQARPPASSRPAPGTPSPRTGAAKSGR